MSIMKITFQNDIFNSCQILAFLDNVLCNDDTLSIQFVSHDAPNRLANADNSPMACNPSSTWGGRYHIVYNKEVINSLDLTILEVNAIIAHEIGHIIRGYLHSDNLEEIIYNEIECDKYAIKAGLGFYLASALNKSSSRIDFFGLDRRIADIARDIDFYRPLWTSGKYSKSHQAALYYNLIEGMSYLFESDSANIVSNFLNSARNTPVNLSKIAETSGIDISSLIDFCNQLLQLNLITDHIWTIEEIGNYRKAVANNRKSIKQAENKSDLSNLVLDDAEAAFTNIVGGITSVMFELTYRCSEQCIHCYNIGSAHDETEISHRHERSELNVNQYKSIIDQFCEMGMFRACLTGGDPFSNPNVWEIIEYLYSKNVAFDVYTNGQRLIGNESKLAQYYPKIVGISIYSGIPEVHDSITRVKGSFEKSISVMNELSRLAIPLYLKCCVMKTNYESYKTVYKIADEMPAFTQIEISVTDSVDGNKFVSRNLRLDKEQYKTLLKDKRIPLYVGLEGTMQTIIPRDSSKNLCKAGINTFNLTPEGYLVPCCRLHIRVGDLKTEKLADIIEESTALKQWLKLTLNDYSECGQKEYCNFCNVCPGLNYSEHNTPLHPAENACFLAKIRHELALELGII